MPLAHPHIPKPSRNWPTAIATLCFVVLTSLWPMSAADQDEAKKDALAAMQTWLGEIDSSDYAKSWTDASEGFKEKVSSDKWVTTLQNVRNPLGKLVNRKLVSSLYQTVEPKVGVDLEEGYFVIAQFETSFENLRFAVETVTFQKQSDGSWRATGYLTRPR